MRSRILAFVALLSVFFSLWVTTPASADHNVVYGHAGNWQWNGLDGGVCRQVLILDRTGNAELQRAIREFAGRFNQDTDNRGMHCRYPWFHIQVQNDQVGNCAATSNRGWQYITVCNFATFGSGVTHMWGSTCHINTCQPASWVSATGDYPRTFALVGHELGHAIGLQHSRDCGSLMAGGEYGCHLPNGRYMTEHDWLAMWNNYGAHPLGY